MDTKNIKNYQQSTYIKLKLDIVILNCLILTVLHNLPSKVDIPTFGSLILIAVRANTVLTTGVDELCKWRVLCKIRKRRKFLLI